MPVMNGKGLAHFIQLFKSYFGITWSVSGDSNDNMITSDEDLNDYTTIGNYYCRPDTEASNVTNNPTSRSFILKVYSGSGYSPNTSNGNYLTQYLENLKGTAWMRYKTTGSWTDWVRVSTTTSDGVGSGTNHIYTVDSTPTKSTSTAGSGIKLMYLNKGAMTTSDSTVGSATKPFYLNGGVYTECDNIGTAATLTVTKSTQNEREARVKDLINYDSSTSSGSGNKTSTAYRFLTHAGISAGTYTVANLLQQLVNDSHTHEFIKQTTLSNCDCNCNCNCNCDSDGE